MDSFKEYIQMNTDSFVGEDVPGKMLFSRINNSLQEKKVVNFYSWGKYAVAACIIGMIFIATFNMISVKPSRHNIADTCIAPCQKQQNIYSVDTQKSKKTDTPTTSLQKNIEEDYLQPIKADDSIASNYDFDEKEMMVNEQKNNSLCSLNLKNKQCGLKSNLLKFCQTLPNTTLNSFKTNTFGNTYNKQFV